MTLFYCTTDQVRVSSIFVGVMPLLECRILKIHSFPHFSLTCFDLLSWNFAFRFILLYYRSSSSVINLRQVLLELCPFWNLEYWKTQFSVLFSYTLWHIKLKFCQCFCFTELQIKIECSQFASIFEGVIPLFELRILKIHSFPHFSLTRFDILSRNVAYDFVLLYNRWSLSGLNLRWFLLELCPFWKSEYWKFPVFCTFLLRALRYWAKTLHMTLFNVQKIKFECHNSVFVWLSVRPSIFCISSYIHRHI